ncbi:MAG: preprotein translocase subunit SecG, partial [Acinetobacter sp. 39-4]
MYSFILVVHIILAVMIIGLVLVQQGKGAEAGASFGGGGAATVFGASGA